MCTHQCKYVMTWNCNVFFMCCADVYHVSTVISSYYTWHCWPWMLYPRCCCPSSLHNSRTKCRDDREITSTVSRRKRGKYICSMLHLWIYMLSFYSRHRENSLQLPVNWKIWHSVLRPSKYGDHVNNGNRVSKPSLFLTGRTLMTVWIYLQSLKQHWLDWTDFSVKVYWRVLK